MYNGYQKKMKSNKGFTLIEIAIVLVIMGLLAGLGAKLIGPLTKRAKILDTRDRVDAAIHSLTSYGAANNMLPATGSFTSTVKDPNDAWTKTLYYVTDNNLTSTTYGGICGRKTTRLTLKNCPDTACASPTSTISNVALIVLSGGGNYNNQTAGTQAISAATTINAYETDVSIDGYTTDVNRTEAYDDIVQWLTIDELRSKAGCGGPQLEIVSNELPYGYEDSAYSATVFASGGVPFSSGGSYRWCRQESASITGLTFSPSTLNSDCLGLAEASWTQANTLAISGTPTVSGSYKLTFFVRDDNDQSITSANLLDNIAQKNIVLTINPAEVTPCTQYRVWNNYGSGRDYYRDGDCDYFSNGSEITTESRYLGTGETFYRYSSNDDDCDSQQASLTFAGAQTADADGDCCVNFTGTDKTCP